MKSLFQIFVVGAVVALLTSLVFPAVPPMINYQGKLTKPTGALIVDTTVTMEFKIYDDSTGGNVLWQETQNNVKVELGIFNVLLGSVTPIPDSAFDGNIKYLGVKIGDEPEMTPRKPILSVGYAMKAGNAREVYHQIMDIPPNSATKFYVVPKYPNSKVTLYLYGEGFGGAVLAHTHGGNNAHSHSFSATTGAQSADHTHNFSSNTGNQSADHTHSGSTSLIDLIHSHAGSSVGYTDPWHTHYGETASSVEHRHTLAVDGAPGTGNYLVISGTCVLSSSNTEDRYCNGSVMLGGAHIHGFNTNIAYINHNHSLSINNSLGSHSHSFTSGGVSANHYHGFSGTTGGISVNHNHGFSGTTESSGTGLGMFGVVAGTFPQSVKVYIDGVLRAGPWSGQFSSGPVDLSPYIPDTQEHSVEIKEEGGNGGRIIYNLYIE